MKVFLRYCLSGSSEVRPCGDSLPMWYGTVRAGIHPAPCLAAEETLV